jgi:hypothetical protein
MNATASLSPTFHVRRGHIAGLALAVAAVTVVALATMWAVRANSDSPPQGNVSGIVAMAPAERAAAFGQTPRAAHQSLQQIVSTITPPAPVSHSHVGGQRVVASSQRPDAIFGPR